MGSNRLLKERLSMHRFEKDASKTFDVKIDAIWTTNLPYFNFDTDIHPEPLARAMAMEPWSKEYFKNLERYGKNGIEIPKIKIANFQLSSNPLRTIWRYPGYCYNRWKGISNFHKCNKRPYRVWFERLEKFSSLRHTFLDPGEWWPTDCWSYLYSSFIFKVWMARMWIVQLMINLTFQFCDGFRYKG